MKIISLKAENVKRLKAVEITPDGAMVVVGGRNAQGKTSVLDSITMALGGAAAACERPLRDGAQHGEIVVDLGDLIVTRSFDAKGGTKLVVKGKDGNKKDSPQTLLDTLAGRLSFDPLSFSRMDRKKQLDTLKALVGLDFTDLDARRKTLFDDRTICGRDGQAVKARLDAMPHHPDVPTQEISAADLIAKVDAAREHNRKIVADVEALNAATVRKAETRRIASEIADKIRQTPEMVAAADRLRDNRIHREELGEQIADLEAKLSEAKQRLAAYLSAQPGLEMAAEEARATAYNRAHEEANAAEKAAADIAQSLVGRQEIPVEPLLAEVANIDTTNRKVRENQNHRDQQKAIELARTRWDELTAAIEVIDKQKKEAMAGAKFPVEGLSFDESGVLFNGHPFSQASSAEQLKVSVAMGMALNPKLRVILIRDGSLLDEDSLRMVAEMAAAHDAQVWLEKVTTDPEGCSVVIEDGGVLEHAVGA